MGNDVRYRFLSVLGEGGFGKVYRARMEMAGGFNKEVAIKVLHDAEPPPSLLKRFKDEARMLGLIRDRAIVRVEAPIQIGGRWAVVMEFVDGVSCGALIARERLPPGVAVEIVGEVARALHAAYNMEGPEGEPLHLLHRDIKPDNIQVTPNGDVRLLDFGIARANFAAREFKTRQSLGGTPGYIAPERLQRVEVPEGDVYSLGVVLHEMVTGARPVFAPTVQFDVDPDATAQDVGLLASSGVRIDDEDLEISKELRADPHVFSVVTLAGWMRSHDHEERPTVRQVEEACRELRQQLPPPYFRNWAETEVPNRPEVEGDDLLGEVLETEEEKRTIVPLATPAPPAVRSDAAPVPVTPGANTGGVALGAALGGGAVLLLAIGLVVGALAGLTALWFASSEPTAPTEQPAAVVEPSPTPTPAPEPTPASTPEPTEAAPALAPAPAPAPAPKPEPVRVIDLSPKPTPRPAPAPARPRPAPAPAAPAPRTGPVGTVVVRTIPSGATVRVGGEVPKKAGGGYVLPVGNHVLDVRSSSGESTKIPVSVTRDDTVHICYSFDTNSACAP